MKYIRNFLALTTFSISLLFFSCTPLKKQIYLQDISGIGDTISHITHEHRIQPGDLLYIRIIGLDEKTYGMFNNTNERSIQTINNETAVFLNSFIVSDSGNISLPIIGKINLIKCTVNEAQLTIQANLNKYIKNSSVIVKHVNFKISVLGEVKSPRSFTVYSKNINLLEALSMAGDLTINANKKNIKVIRQGENGKVSYINKIDITKRDFLRSEYFLLKPNDIIYIEPLRAKSYSTNPFPITTLLSIITTTVLTLNFIINN